MKRKIYTFFCYANCFHTVQNYLVWISICFLLSSKIYGQCTVGSSSITWESAASGSQTVIPTSGTAGGPPAAVSTSYSLGHCAYKGYDFTFPIVLQSFITADLDKVPTYQNIPILTSFNKLAYINNCIFNPKSFLGFYVSGTSFFDFSLKTPQKHI